MKDYKEKAMELASGKTIGLKGYNLNLILKNVQAIQENCAIASKQINKELNK